MIDFIWILKKCSKTTVNLCDVIFNLKNCYTVVLNDNLQHLFETNSVLMSYWVCLSRTPQLAMGRRGGRVKFCEKGFK